MGQDKREREKRDEEKKNVALPQSHTDHRLLTTHTYAHAHSPKADRANSIYTKRVIT